MKLLALFIVAFLAVGALGQDSCNAWTSCGTCTAQSSCGWCTYSGTCESGNGTGSFVGCTSPYWIWTEGYCPATPAPASTCGQATSCFACTSLGSCGWCSFNNQCEAGNGTGSFQGCVAPYWSWTNNQCQVTPAPTPYNTCSEYTTCSGCTGVSNCGFCMSTGVCEVGNSTGSLNGDCSGTWWAWVNSQCSATPAPSADPCNAYNGECYTCTSQGSCGYCLTSGMCETGTGSGSNSGDCSGTNWAWTTGQCSATPTPSDPCSPYNGNCAGCTAQGSCGYCLSSGMCETGSGSGSNSGDCSGTNWAWTSGQCATPAPSDACSAYNGNCSSCTAQGTCGYCISSGMCETGSGSGSNSGDCSGTNWAWYSSSCPSTTVRK